MILKSYAMGKHMIPPKSQFQKKILLNTNFKSFNLSLKFSFKCSTAKSIIELPLQNSPRYVEQSRDQSK